MVHTAPHLRWSCALTFTLLCLLLCSLQFIPSYKANLKYQFIFILTCTSILSLMNVQFISERVWVYDTVWDVGSVTECGRKIKSRQLCSVLSTGYYSRLIDTLFYCYIKNRFVKNINDSFATVCWTVRVLCVPLISISISRLIIVSIVLGNLNLSRQHHWWIGL